MPTLGKLIGLVSLSKAMSATPPVRKLLSGVAAAAALAIISMVMVSALLVGALIALYRSLLYAGWEPASALAVTATLAVAVTALCILLTVWKIRHLLSPEEVMHQTGHSITARVTGVADAFVDGLLTHKATANKSR